jgi:hypothetical protein
MLGLNLEEIYTLLQNLSTANFKNNFGGITIEREREIQETP